MKDVIPMEIDQSLRVMFFLLASEIPKGDPKLSTSEVIIIIIIIIRWIFKQFLGRTILEPT